MLAIMYNIKSTKTYNHTIKGTSSASNMCILVKSAFPTPTMTIDKGNRLALIIALTVESISKIEVRASLIITTIKGNNNSKLLCYLLLRRLYSIHLIDLIDLIFFFFGLIKTEV